jgi:hypothetical protein
MTRTEERLADALDAVARAVREDTLRPLREDTLSFRAPERRRRPRHAWAVPAAAAAAVLLAVGLAAAVTRLSGTGHVAAPVMATDGPPRYYVDTEAEMTVVRATATGAVTAYVEFTPWVPGGEVVSAADGEFFILGGASSQPATDNTLYRFRLTGSGQVTGFSPVPGGVFSRSAMVESAAASPDGSKVALALATGSSAEIVVINTATGARTVWQGGMAGPGSSFGITDLSWTSRGELVFLAQWCTSPFPASIGCRLATLNNPATTSTDSQVWALDPGSAGGQLDNGHLLLGQSAQYPRIMQAVISPDGSTLTAIVLNQLASFTDTRTEYALSAPGRFSVDQIAVAGGVRLSTLYQGSFGRENQWQLSSDGTAGHWLIVVNDDPGSGPGPDFDLNGWITHGHLTALQPVGGVYGEAW